MKTHIGFQEALRLTLDTVPCMGSEYLPLHLITSRILKNDMLSKVDSPSLTASMKDGYAVISLDLDRAAKNNPIKLQVIGAVTAGNATLHKIVQGQAVRLTTGAPIPEGADAVLAEEFCRRSGDEITCVNTADPGRNTLKKGTDIKIGETIAKQGLQLSPPMVGLLASAGHDGAQVVKRPRVAVIATGDEVIAPGTPLKEGKLYASNLVEICSWLSLFGMHFETAVVPDNRQAIRAAIQKFIPTVDVFITSGGSLSSERDLMLKVLEDLNWQGIYHRVRMGPGKGIGFGLLKEKPFFFLPGGPPSAEITFLQIALPGLLHMQGHTRPAFPTMQLKLDQAVKGRRDWTQFIHAGFFQRQGETVVRPAKLRSRLQSMAKKQTLIVIPQGIETIPSGTIITVQVLSDFNDRAFK
jgi:molybdopterin molybdotransferase